MAIPVAVGNEYGRMRTLTAVLALSQFRRQAPRDGAFLVAKVISLHERGGDARNKVHDRKPSRSEIWEAA
jgi:hypothetical protein